MADAALQALGVLFVARPGFMLLQAPQAAMHAALQPCAPPLLKNRALLNLTELLKVCHLAQQSNHLLHLHLIMLLIEPLS